MSAECVARGHALLRRIHRNECPSLNTPMSATLHAATPPPTNRPERVPCRRAPTRTLSTWPTSSPIAKRRRSGSRSTTCQRRARGFAAAARAPTAGELLPVAFEIDVSPAARVRRLGAQAAAVAPHVQCLPDAQRVVDDRDEASTASSSRSRRRARSRRSRWCTGRRNEELRRGHAASHQLREPYRQGARADGTGVTTSTSASAATTCSAATTFRVASTGDEIMGRRPRPEHAGYNVQRAHRVCSASPARCSARSPTASVRASPTSTTLAPRERTRALLSLRAIDAIGKYRLRPLARGVCRVPPPVDHRPCARPLPIVDLERRDVPARARRERERERAETWAKATAATRCGCSTTSPASGRRSRGCSSSLSTRRSARRGSRVAASLSRAFSATATRCRAVKSRHSYWRAATRRCAR